jgi:UDP:flavonoid glycosyltransferase YjiC (YdhE family)
VPDEWPGKIHLDDAGLADLKEIARDVDRAFTSEFNEVIQGTAEPLTPVTSAFSFGSAYARVFNYPETASTYPRHAGRDLFIGHCTSGGDTLPDEWRKDIEHLTGRPRVLIVFGTFQWVHTDVMRTVHQGIAQAFPDASFVISAGDRQSQLADINGERTLVRDFVPQQALLSHMDLFVTHGGNNSFTESLVTGVPLLVLPFASDQFAVAHDVERTGLGRVLDPNHLRPRDVADAAAHALTGAVRERVTRMSAHVLSRGPSWAAEHLIRRMSTVDPSNL